MSDAINPSHYQKHNGIQTIDIMEKILTPRGLAYHCLGNAIKYLDRKGLKEGNPEEQDVNKAIWYLDKFDELVSDKKVIIHDPVREFVTKLRESCVVGVDMSWLEDWDVGLYIY